LVRLQDPEDYEGKTFELAGEHNFTWRELMDFTFDVREKREGGGRGRCAGCGPSREKLWRKEALPGEGCDVMVLPVLPT
jgi:hypothetical protein